MRSGFVEPFAVNPIASSPEVRKAFGKQLTNLLRDLRHPSLRAKKYEERTGLWQARINDDWLKQHSPLAGTNVLHIECSHVFRHFASKMEEGGWTLVDRRHGPCPVAVLHASTLE